MDLENVLAALRKERDAIEAAILSLERLSRAGEPASHCSSGFSMRGCHERLQRLSQESGDGREFLGAVRP